jgi:hypothetical protein
VAHDPVGEERRGLLTGNIGSESTNEVLPLAYPVSSQPTASRKRGGDVPADQL